MRADKLRAMLTGIFKDKQNSKLGPPRTPELALRRLLQAKSLRGAMFQARATLGPFVVDFVCHDRSLVVELADDETRQYFGLSTDARAQFLTNLGYRVVRVTRKEILRLPEQVIARVRHALEEAHPAPAVVPLAPKR